MADSDDSSSRFLSAHGVEDIDSVPLHTTRTYDALVNAFADRLAELAISNTKVRGSKTPTDADLHQAFRDLTAPNRISKVKRFIGDGMMIAGGVFLPLWSTTPLLTIAGVCLCLGGLYVRETAE